MSLTRQHSTMSVHTPTITGGVQRILVDKLMDDLSAFDCGATPYTGRYDTARSSLTSAVADSRAAIQAAINGAWLRGGGTVRLPYGIFRLDGPLKPRPGVTLIGCGAYVPNWGGVNSGTMLWASGDFPCISHIGSLGTYNGTHDAGVLTGFVVAQLTVHGNGYRIVNPDGTYGAVRMSTKDTNIGIDLRFANRCGIYDVQAFSLYAGFRFQNNWQTHVERCHLHGGEGQRSYIGFWNAESDYENANGVVNNAVIYNGCVAAKCQFAGYYMQHTQGTKMVSCEAPADPDCMFGMLIGDLSSRQRPNPLNGGVLKDNVCEFLAMTNCLFDTVDGYGVMAFNRWFDAHAVNETRNLVRRLQFSGTWVGSIGIPYRNKNGDETVEGKPIIDAADIEYAARDYIASRLGVAAGNIASGNGLHFYGVGYATLTNTHVARTAKHGIYIDTSYRINISGAEIENFAQYDTTASGVRIRSSHTITLGGVNTWTNHVNGQGLVSTDNSDYIAYGAANNWHNGVSLVGSNNTTGNLTNTGVVF